MRVDVQGAESVRKLAPEALLIFITCENEQDGIQKAQKLVDGFDLELWDGPRFIIRLTAA